MILNIISFLLGIWFAVSGLSLYTHKDYKAAMVAFVLGILVWLLRLM